MTRDIEGSQMGQDMIVEVKKAVMRDIAAIIDNNVVPELIRDFLKGPWTEVMNIIGLRDDCKGKGWSAVLRLAEDLVWSVQPKTQANERQRLLDVLPYILEALQNGLLLIYYSPRELDEFFKKLEQLHLNCMRNESVAKAANAVGNLDFGKKQKNSCALNDEILKQIINQSSKHDAFQSDLSNPQLMKSRHFEPVLSMALGTWVEFKHFNTSKRGKLAWKCDFTGEFTFMDRRFKVIADVSLRDLIRQFETGKAHIVTDVPFIDRAIEVIVNGMKQTVSRNNKLAQVTS